MPSPRYVAMNISSLIVLVHHPHVNIRYLNLLGNSGNSDGDPYTLTNSTGPSMFVKIQQKSLCSFAHSTMISILLELMIKRFIK